MIDDPLTESQAARILRRELGYGEWQLSAPMGTMQATRLARRGPRAVAVKLLQTPAVIMERLSDLGVTPPVIALGEDNGRPYLVQQAVEGPHPDHAWFAEHRSEWAAMLRRYLQDPELADLLAARKGFWRLDMTAAAAMIDADLERAPRHGPALQGTDFESGLDRWRSRSASVRSRPMRPIHPDAHWHNYLLADGVPQLLDWDYIDLSDPLRDVGSQVWGFLPQRYWSEFVTQTGLTVDDDLAGEICWWAGFKMLSNAIFNDRRGDRAGATFHADAFMIAAQDRPWLG